MLYQLRSGVCCFALDVDVQVTFEMAKTPRIASRWAAIHALKRFKQDVRITAKNTGKSVSYVRRWKQQYRKTGNVNDRPRSGRKIKISAAVRAAAVTLVAEHQSVPVAAAILKEQQLLEADIHVTTVLRAVKKDMQCNTAEQRPILSQKTMEKRVTYSQQEHDSDTVIAADSTFFTLGTVQRRRKYWSMKGQRVVAGRPNKSQQLHVYGAIAAHGKTVLVFVTGTTGHAKLYYNNRRQLTGVGAEEFQEVMKDRLVPDAEHIFAAAGISEYTWLLDNAPAHTARSTKQFFTSKGIQVIQGWPPNSPDLNPIENVWAWMKQRVYSKQYNTLAELKAAVLETWQEVPDSMCSNLMHSLQKRKAICIERNGGYTGH